MTEHSAPEGPRVPAPEDPRDNSVPSRDSALAVKAPVQIIVLESGRLRAVLRPDLGGAIAGVWLDGKPVLHGAQPEGLESAEAAAVFPCAPFAQELGRARLRWIDTTHSLEAHPTVAPHALNGVAWRRPWEVVSVGPRSAQIRYRHAPDGAWPFAFDVQQIIEVSGASVAIQLVLANQHAKPQPAGLGWQIAFARGRDTRVQFDCRERWDIDPATRLPRGKVPVQGASGTLDALGLPHTYEGWSGALRVHHGARMLRLHSSLDRLAFAADDHADHFRAGPVSHAPDAFHMGSPTANGLAVLPAAASIEAWMKLDIGR